MCMVYIDFKVKKAISCDLYVHIMHEIQWFFTNIYISCSDYTTPSIEHDLRYHNRIG